MEQPENISIQDIIHILLTQFPRKRYFIMLEPRQIYISFSALSSLQDPQAIYKRHLIGYPLKYGRSQH